MIEGGQRNQPIAKALAALDAAFARVTPPASIDACPCCRTPRDYARLLDHPRSALTAADLSAYTFRALTTVGSATDFRYLAGRILQLLHTDDRAMPDMEVVYGKLRLAGWQTWPEAEAVTSVMDALWAHQFTNDLPEGDIGAVLCALGTAQGTVAHRLIDWSDLADAAKVRQLHDFVLRHCRVRGGTAVPSNAYWDRASEAYGELVEWLDGGAALGAVVAAFERSDDSQTLELLGEIHSFLDR
ncbi:hypothetical protein [Nocardia sp. NPDC050718]|uniref:hypothetical protein n=1 Tax=Nocardia sp. NPDC050718 TaxID=3155788 RepID=UPI0033E9ADB9